MIVCYNQIQTRFIMYHHNAWRTQNAHHIPRKVINAKGVLHHATYRASCLLMQEIASKARNSAKYRFSNNIYHQMSIHISDAINKIKSTNQKSGFIDQLLPEQYCNILQYIFLGKNSKFTNP